MSYQRLQWGHRRGVADIVDRYHAVASRCDAMVIIGSDFTTPPGDRAERQRAHRGQPRGSGGAVGAGASDRTPDEIAGGRPTLHGGARRPKHAHTAAVVANRCDPGQLDAVARACSDLGAPVYVIPEEPLLVAPTVGGCRPPWTGYSCTRSLPAGEEVRHVMVAGMTAERFAERLQEGRRDHPGDRSDVVLALSRECPCGGGFPSISTLILNGGLPLHREIGRLVTGLGLRLPIIATELGTFATASAVANTREAGDGHLGNKIDTTAVDRPPRRHVEMLERLAIPDPHRHHAADVRLPAHGRARSDRKRIVLPKGTTTVSCRPPAGCCAAASPS